MDIHDIERAAILFYQMCREHPEICPHDYGCQFLKTDKEKKIIIEIYECHLCGTTMKIEKPIKE